MNVKKIGIFTILITFLMLCSIAASFAGTGIGGMKDIDYSENYVQLSVNQKIYSVEKSTIPSKYKQYENKTFQVAKGKKTQYKASVNSAGNLFYDLKGVKVKKASIDFGDGTKKTSTGWISHSYKKAGWYKIKVTIIEATFTDSKSGLISSSDMSGEITNTTREYLVKVTNKAQLDITGNITSYSSNKKDYKKGNINYLTVKVTNTGSVTSKATKIKIWYQDPKKFGKVYSKYKKYTKSAKLKALKPGQSTTVKIYFSIPKKLSKLVKNIRLDSLNKVNMISRSDSIYSF